MGDLEFCSGGSRNGTLLFVENAALKSQGVGFTGKKNGRGAYICDSEECIKKLGKAKLLNRAFSSPVSDEVYAGIVEAYLAKK